MIRKIVAFLLLSFQASALVSAAVYEFEGLEYLNDIAPLYFGMVVVFGVFWFGLSLYNWVAWLHNDRSDTVTIMYLICVLALHLLPGSELTTLADIFLFVITPLIVMIEAYIAHKE